MSSNAKAWSAVAPAYSDGAARATGDGGKALLKLVEELRPFQPDSIVLDSGAGTGVLTDLIVRSNDSISVIAGDVAQGLLHILEQRGLRNTTTIALDATKDHVRQGLAPNYFTHAVTSFMLQFVDLAQNAVIEMHRVLQPGGIIGIAIWSENQVTEPWETACKSIDAAYTSGNVISETAWRSVEDVETAVKTAGFEDIRSSETQVTLSFKNAEAFAEYFLTSQNPPFMSVIRAWPGKIEDVREKFVEVIREQYDDGKLKMVAACTVGRKPTS